LQEKKCSGKILQEVVPHVSVGTENLRNMKHLLNRRDTTKSKRLSSGGCEGETKSKAERFIE
jgi:hypothetical protein